MTTTSDRLSLPARRRRHASRIAELTLLIGSCAEAAGAVYGPIATAPPNQQDVEVTLLPCHQVSLVAALSLDRARAQDVARWPAAVQREETDARRTHAARVVVAHARYAAEQAEQPVGPYSVPLPTAEQSAAIDLAAAGDEVAALWRRDPEEAIARVRELTVGGELAAGEILDQAADAAEQTGVLALQPARTALDPSAAAELLLAAVPHFVLAVHLLSVDPS